MSRGPILLGVGGVLTALSTILVALRIYCRRFIVDRLGTDDWAMLAASLNIWGVGAINVLQLQLTSGKPQMQKADYTRLLKVRYAYAIEYLIALFFVKLSILEFYRRLSPARVFQLGVKIAAGVVVAFTVTFVFIEAFQCPKDPKLAWAVTYPRGCYNLVPVSYTQGTLNIVTDAVIYILPLPTILRLQVNKKSRVALMLVFSVGSVAVIASIVRLVTLVAYQRSQDQTGDGMLVLIWSQVELNIAVICASAPAIRPLLNSLRTADASYNYSAASAAGALGRGNHNHLALKTFGSSGRPVEPGPRCAVTGAAASESGENIVMKSDGEGRSADVISLDIRMGRVEVLGDELSESSRDLEYGR